MDQSKDDQWIASMDFNQFLITVGLARILPQSAVFQLISPVVNPKVSDVNTAKFTGLMNIKPLSRN